ncbi:MAG TPA: hypothetical protein VK463_01330 [Desulfomonilaceae bacterium]|nr:hypothetical protein [Desulfomonilaceae bacterium]
MNLTKKLEKWFSAIAFAEMGEHATAMEMVGMTPARPSESAGIVRNLQTAFAAAAFAEADCSDMALEILGERKRQSFLDAIGLRGARVWYAAVPLQEESFIEAVGLRGARLKFGTVQI